METTQLFGKLEKQIKKDKKKENEKIDTPTLFPPPSLPKNKKK